MKRLVSGIILTLLLTSMLTLAFNIHPVKASGTIYIRADGSIDPPTAPISTADNVTYTLTDNINDSIVVERDNIAVDGAGHTVTGSGSADGGSENGTTLTGRSNVTVGNMTIKDFSCGIVLNYSSNNILSGNNVTNNWIGILLESSSDNVLSDNTLSGNNTIYECGIWLVDSSNNNVLSGNNVTNNWLGILFYYSSNNSVFYHNNFISNTPHVLVAPPESANSWDDGYPSGGNYWSDYTGVDMYCGPYQNESGSDGMGDTPYVIDADNRDNYPLMKPYPWSPHDVGITSVTTSKNIVGQGLTAKIDVSVLNEGNFTETFNVTVYANTTAIQTETLTLTSQSFTILTPTWDTTGFAEGNYTIWAYTEPVSGETDTADNTFVDGLIKVSCLGDLNGDYVADGQDYQIVKNAIPSMPELPRWNPNADLNDDGIVDGQDFQTVKNNIGQSGP